jgi:hypothetical protein
MEWRGLKAWRLGAERSGAEMAKDFESDTGLPDCPMEHYTDVAVYNENCVLAGRRCYPDNRSNNPCGYPHGDVHFISQEEARKLGI